MTGKKDWLILISEVADAKLRRAESVFGLDASDIIDLLIRENLTDEEHAAQAMGIPYQSPYHFEEEE